MIPKSQIVNVSSFMAKIFSELLVSRADFMKIGILWAYGAESRCGNANFSSTKVDTVAELSNNREFLKEKFGTFIKNVPKPSSEFGVSGLTGMRSSSVLL